MIIKIHAQQGLFPVSATRLLFQRIPLLVRSGVFLVCFLSYFVSSAAFSDWLTDCRIGGQQTLDNSETGIKGFSTNGKYVCQSKNGRSYDENGAYLGRVDENGRLYNKNGAYQGRLVNGRLYGKNGSYLGRFNSGRSYDKDGNYRGRVDRSGHIYDKNSGYIGRFSE